jgi:hypothetical protein
MAGVSLPFRSKAAFGKLVQRLALSPIYLLTPED